MPTYQQRFGHRKDPAIITPKPKKRVVQNLTRSAPLAQRESGIGTQPTHKAPLTALERQVFAHKRYLLSQELTRKNVAGAKPNAVGKFIGGIGQHPLGTLRDVTGIDVHRFYHPVRAIQQDRSRAATVGRQIQSGKLSLAEAAPEAGSAIFPGGGRIPGLGRLFGRSVKEVAAPAEKGAAAEVVSKSLGSARRLRAEQKKLYSEERSARVSRATEAAHEAGGGLAGHFAGLAELKGELPKTTFTRLREGRLSQNDLEGLVRQIDVHPELQFFEKSRARQALIDAFEHGKTPAPHQIKLLQTVFGQEGTDALAHASRLKQLGSTAIDALNIPRTLMASVDLSAPFRQGLVAGAGHPGLFFKNFHSMFKAFGSERAYQGILDDIHARPNFDLYEQGGVKFTELGRDVSKREEQFMSNIAGRLPLVRGSSRAYTGFLDKMRADVFDHMIEAARLDGVNVEDRKFLRGLGHYVNSATGRGSLGPAESWAPALNTMFFSPRLIASRINFLDPTWYLRLDPYARKQALKSVIRLGGAASLVLGLGAYGGAKVVTDPRNSDFAKLKLGNTRVDILGGFQQYARLVSQVTTGKIVSSTTGKTLTLGPGFGDLSRKDILERFATGKFAPPPSFIYDFFKGTQFDGSPFSVKKAILQRIIPLVAQDAYDLQKAKGSIPLTALGYGISAFGIGMQTYGPKLKKSKHYGGSGGSGGGGGSRNPYLAPSGGGSNPYLPGGGSTSSNPYLP